MKPRSHDRDRCPCATCSARRRVRSQIQRQTELTLRAVRAAPPPPSAPAPTRKEVRAVLAHEAIAAEVRATNEKLARDRAARQAAEEDHRAKRFLQLRAEGKSPEEAFAQIDQEESCTNHATAKS